jgi:hypothetical protein
MSIELSIPDASKKRWCRKPVKDFDPSKHDLSFQQMDTDYYVQASTHIELIQLLPDEHSDAKHHFFMSCISCIL